MSRNTPSIAGAVAALLTVASVTACSPSTPADRTPSTGSGSTAAARLPRGSEPVKLDPANFSVTITNKYWPMKVGDRWTFRETDTEGGNARVLVTVLDETKTTASGIKARVVHDLMTEGGAVVEDTRDLYAQDAAGNIWYLGEETAEYSGGKVTSTAGSWEAGVQGARPGIALPAHPRPGLEYRQEYLKGEAEDGAVVLGIHERAQSPNGISNDALLTRETTPLEPDVAELKLHIPGVGPVLSVDTSGGTSRETLIETTQAK